MFEPNMHAEELTRLKLRADLQNALSAEQFRLDVLTEAALTTDPAMALRNLRLLKEQGVRLSVAGFGTGPSSLSLLRQFPVDRVKVDRSFVSGVTRSKEDRAVVRAIVDVGRALDLEVVAEGIEDVWQLQSLARMGCHLGQWSHLYGPMEPRMFADIIQEGWYPRVLAGTPTA